MIGLNPNATDTDFDGLADGQELFVTSVKTPKRTPVGDQRWTYSDPMTIAGGGPAWAVSSAILMTGLTHPDMDRDGLNDSGEVNLASDGFAIKPWSADSDANRIFDGLESTG